MSRKGKMNNSPFHIETISYVYAIEHENSGYIIPDNAVKCDSLVKSTNACTRWNSGYTNCLAHKCRYNGGKAQRSVGCKKCAFFLTDCRNPKKPEKEKLAPNEASFCCYYIGKETEPRYSQIRRCVLRIEYTSEYKALSKKCSRRRGTIRNFQRELQLCDERSPDYKYLQDKIKEKEALNRQDYERKEKLKEQIDKLGGPLEKWEFKEPRKRRIT